MDGKMLLSKYVLCIFIIYWRGSCWARPNLSYLLAHVDVTLLVALSAIPLACNQTTRRRRRTNETTTTTPEFTTFRKFHFEGVDWTIHPAMYQERLDCEGHYIRCVRRTTPLIPVCGFNLHTRYFEDYYSICELEMENCDWRKVSRGYKPYHGVWWVNKIYHGGESYDCVHLYRRANSPEELDLIFFGGDRDLVLADWNRRNYEFYFSSNNNQEGYNDYANLD